jgi:hypothetical protein
MEKIVADLDFHGCLLRGARPNRILNRYDRKRERDRGQSAFCVPINHFSPPPHPMNGSPSSWSNSSGKTAQSASAIHSAVARYWLKIIAPLVSSGHRFRLGLSVAPPFGLGVPH